MVHPFATGSVRLSLAFGLFFSQAPIVIVIVVMIIVVMLVFVVAVFVFPRMKSLQSVRESLNVNLEPFQPLHQFWRALMIATSRTCPHLNHFAQLVQTGCV